MATISSEPTSPHDNDQVLLKFDDLQYSVLTTLDAKPPSTIDKLKRTNLKTRYLLRDISAEVRSGSVLAIMGPSGAGKTTLLNMLTLQRAGGVPRGTITLNGKTFSQSLYNKHAAYVQQHDDLWATLTARDHLEYAVRLYRPSLPADAIAAEVDELVASVGLTDSQHIKAGNMFMRGLSSGMKRRLSIAIALAKRPQVLFLDEPTSGIDSASATLLMDLLKRLASARNIAIACTIHQPSASVFAGFDKTLILSEGRTAYFGLAADMGAYLGSLGKPLPEGANPAEYVLDLVNKDFVDAATVERILDAYSAKSVVRPQSGGDSALQLPVPPKPAGFCQQTLVLTQRLSKLVRRDPMLYLARFFMLIIVSIFFSVVYIETRNRVQQQALQRFFFSIFIIGVSSNFAVVVVFAGNMELSAVKREVKDGQYSPLAFFLAQQVVQIPAMFVLGIAALIPMFGIGGLHWPSFGVALCVISANLWSFEGLAQMLSLGTNPILGMLNFTNLWFTGFLFSGMFVRFVDVIWPFRLFCYVLPIGWTAASLMYTVMVDSPDYADAFDCDAGSTGEALCITGRDFYCSPDIPPHECFGRTGRQVLDSVGVSYSIFSSESNTARNLGIILGFGAFCRLLYAVGLAMEGRAGDAPLPLTDETRAPAPGSGATPVVKRRAEAGGEVPVSVDAPALNADAEKYTFTFDQCSSVLAVDAKGKKPMLPCMKATGTKKLIDSLSATISSGEVLAILGPSGSGKTMLLNTLTLEEGPGKVSGTVTLNGEKFTYDRFRKYAAYVPKEDTLWASLTARQHLEHAFVLERPQLTADERAAKVDALLEATGLTSAQHTKAGNAIFKGLSGGQKRRLALAIVLVKEPKVLILDEPTTGLDSAAAAGIMKFLKALALREGLCVMATVHQPSAAVYSYFDLVLILAKGATAYVGPANGMAPHFAKIGKPFPSGANPAEAVLDAVSPPKDREGEVDEILEAWTGYTAPAVAHTHKLVEPAAKAGVLAQTLALFKRNVRLLVRDPTLYSARIIMLVFFICFFGVVYVNTRPYVQAQVLPRFFFSFWTVNMPASFAAIAVFAFNIEYYSMRQEVRNGTISPVSYLIANAMVQLPIMLLEGLCISIPAFAIGNWPWDGFVQTFLLMSANMWVWECMAQFFSVMSNPILGMLNFFQNWFAATLFCGFVVRPSGVIWPFRLFYYILPFSWLFNGLSYQIFFAANYEGTVPCANPDVSVCPRPFTCPGDTSGGLECWGANGSEILKTASTLYEVVTQEDKFGLDLGILIAQAVVWKLFYFMSLYSKCTKVVTPSAPA